MASNEELEEKQLQLEGEICQLATEKLEQLAEHLDIPLAKYNGKSRLAISRVVRQRITEQVEAQETTVQQMEYLVNFGNFIAEQPPPLESDDNEGTGEELSPSLSHEQSESEDNGGTGEDLSSSLSHEEEPQTIHPDLQDLQKKMDQLVAEAQSHQKQIQQAIKLNGESDGSGGKKATSSSPSDINNVLRRDLKIRGQIGTPGEENKLSFISLIRQIEAALAKGYPEGEVIEAIIRAICPGMPLRSYLESTPDLTLSILRQILRSHYRERNATDLHQQLASLTQSPGENPQTFLMKALELRQKILFASKEASATIKYDQQLVQSLFLHCLETGLRDDAVRVKMRPLLQNTEVSDEELIKEISLASSTETERKMKFQAGHKQRASKASCGQIVTPESDGDPKPEKPNEKERKGHLVETVAAVQAEVASLKEAVSALTTNARPQWRERRRVEQRRACQQCQYNENVTRCNHCFHCGSPDHYARSCRQNPRRSNLGNRSGLRPWDRE